jgi:hypothetical protein
MDNKQMIIVRDPMAKALSFTHILQIDFVKRPEERIVIADWFIASTVLIPSTGDLQKMWDKNQG